MVVGKGFSLWKRGRGKARIGWAPGWRGGEEMKVSSLAVIAAMGLLAIALLAVMTLRYTPAGSSGDTAIFILDRLTGEVCVSGASSGSLFSFCVPRGAGKHQ